MKKAYRFDLIVSFIFVCITIALIPISFRLIQDGYMPIYVAFFIVAIPIGLMLIRRIIIRCIDSAQNKPNKE